MKSSSAIKFCLTIFSSILFVYSSLAQRQEKRLIDASALKEIPLNIPKSENRIITLHFGPLSDQLAVGSGKNLGVYTLATGNSVWTKTGDEIEPLSMTSVVTSNPFMIVAENKWAGGKVHLFSWANGEQMGALSPFDGGRSGIDFYGSPYDTKVTWCGPEGRIFGYDFQKNSFYDPQGWQLYEKAVSVAHGAYGRFLTGGNDGKVYAFNKPEEKTELMSFGNYISTVAGSFYIKDLIEPPYCAAGDNRGYFKVATITTGQIEYEAKFGEEITDIKFHPTDPSIVVVTSRQGLHIVNFKTKQVLKEVTFGPRAWSMDISLDGTKIAVGLEDGTIKLFGL